MRAIAAFGETTASARVKKSCCILWALCRKGRYGTLHSRTTCVFDGRLQLPDDIGNLGQIGSRKRPTRDAVTRPCNSDCLKTCDVFRLQTLQSCKRKPEESGILRHPWARLSKFGCDKFPSAHGTALNVEIPPDLGWHRNRFRDGSPPLGGLALCAFRAAGAFARAAVGGVFPHASDFGWGRS